MKKMNFLTRSALVAALYTVLTVIPPFNAIAYGPVQFRISEILCFLVFLDKRYIWALSVGTLIANLLSPVGAADIIIGTAATVIGCYAGTKITNKYVFPVAIILSNAILVGLMLCYFYIGDMSIKTFMLCFLEVGIGEAAVLYILGLPFLKYISKLFSSF